MCEILRHVALMCHFKCKVWATSCRLLAGFSRNAFLGCCKMFTNREERGRLEREGTRCLSLTVIRWRLGDDVGAVWGLVEVFMTL